MSKNPIPHIQLTGGEISLLGVDVVNDFVNKLAKTSAVSIVTNGIKTLNKLSKNISAIYVSLHGSEKIHEMLTRHPRGWGKTIKTIEHYVGEGFSVTSDTIMTHLNYKEIPSVAAMAKQLGMKQVMVNRFEDGGLGSQNRNLLRPTKEQFREALSLMIEAQEKYKISIDFGTAIPFCLDKRLMTQNLISRCGAGTGFAAVSPEGNLRICNQSQRIYGNIFKETIRDIWKKNILDEYRCLSWVAEPCQSCPALRECRCGCFVDASQPKTYCIDYAIREQFAEDIKHGEQFGLDYPNVAGISGSLDGHFPGSYPQNYRIFKQGSQVSVDGKILVVAGEKYSMGKHAKEILHAIINGESCELSLVNKFKAVADEKALRNLLSCFMSMGALSINGYEEVRS